MEEAKELYNDAKESIKQIAQISIDRLKNPLLGAFFISFIFYNWKAILYLIFSKCGIEDKISEIEVSYSDSKSIYIPIIIAICYNLFLPFILLIFEYIVSYSYKWRLGVQYSNKISETRKKGVLAFSERRTQEIVSGNKQLKDLFQQIKNLQNELEQLQITNRNREEIHNNQLIDLNNLLNEASEKIESTSLSKRFNSSNTLWNNYAKNLSYNDAREIVSLPNKKGTYFKKEKLPENEIKQLLDYDLIERNPFESDSYSITEQGIKFKEFIARIYI